MTNDTVKNLRDTVLNGKDPKERLKAAKKLQQAGAGDVLKNEQPSQHSDSLVRLIAREIKKLLATD